MKGNIKLVIFLLFTQLSISQNSQFFKTYDWDDIPSFNPDSSSDEDIKALKHAIVTEFYFENENSLVEYFLEHKVLWLNSDQSIEDYNKVYIPYSQHSEIEINKARVIKKNGEIIELDSSKILTSQDEETGRVYKYFAFEGVEKGSIIEYYYVVKRQPRYKGAKLDFQSSYPKENVTFDLYSPKNLLFGFKSYNRFPEVKRDTLVKDKLHWSSFAKELKRLDKEEYSAYHASKSAVIYKLDKNLVNNKGGFSSYSAVAKNLYAYYYADHSKKMNALLSKFVSNIPGIDNENSESKIRKLENYIKKNVYVSKANNPELKDLKEILSKKVANETGVLMLFTSALRVLNIKHELVITSNRQELKFDKDFEAQNFLTDFLIYFPDHKTYLSPASEDSRYGFPPAYLTDNYGLFIKEIKLGDFKSGVGKVKYIEPVKAQSTIDSMIVDVNFDKSDLVKNNIKIERSLSGYYAMYIQPFTGLISKEDKESFIDSYAKRLSENVEITNKKMLNDEPSLFGIKPLSVEIEFNSEAFVEKAGKKYLFKVGELIGKQTQMYNEKKRVLPIENEFNRKYLRVINLTIPEGYKVVNLDDININNSHVVEGEKIISFHSFYKTEDNIVTITANEYYKQNIYDVTLYEKYREVINSAADFNKITLVLEPI